MNDIEDKNAHCEVEDCNDDCTVEVCEAPGCAPCNSVETLQKVGAVDVILSKIISRKLLVFGVATGLLMWYGLDPDTWGLIAMIYVGGQSVIDTVKVWKHG
jgi:hypothetical protein